MNYTVVIETWLGAKSLIEGEVPLDLTKVAAQVVGMVARLKDARKERQEHLQNALDVVSNEAIDLDDLKRKIAASKTTWLVADLVDSLASHYGVPPTPTAFTNISTVGSKIYF